MFDVFRLASKQIFVSLNFMDRWPVIISFHAWNLFLMASIHIGCGVTVISEIVVFGKSVVATIEWSDSSSVVGDDVSVSTAAVWRVVSCRRWVQQFAIYLGIVNNIRVFPWVLWTLAFWEWRCLDKATVIVHDESVSSTTKWLVVWVFGIKSPVKIVINSVIHL